MTVIQELLDVDELLRLAERKLVKVRESAPELDESNNGALSKTLDSVGDALSTLTELL